MKVIPFQVQFDIPDLVDGEKKTTRYGEPDISTIQETEPEEDGSFVFHTHDRCGSCKPGSFYQIVFRIIDPVPYNKKDLSLSLDRRIYRNSAEPISNDLYYDKKADLWYQRSKYKLNKKTGNWELVAENKKGSLNVESITTSGVFKACVLLKGQYLNNPEYDLPWIYVLPSTVNKKAYTQMLSDLLELNERLIRKDESSVGVGGLTAIEEETNELRREIENTIRLQDAIKNAMCLPSELLGKKYKKTTLDKADHFDSKTLRDYIKYGMSGQISGVEYFENHDTYENRVIKYILKQININNKHEDYSHIMSEREVKKETERRVNNNLSLARTVNTINDSYKKDLELKIKADIQRKNDFSKTRNELIDTRKEIVKLLESKWFNYVEDLQDLAEIRPTTKFISNRYYSEIYKIITENFIDKPFISASFDINAFGINSTHLVYEYWVFYKILSHLMNIGFEMNSRKALKDHFTKFRRNQLLDSMVIPMRRKDEHSKQEINIEVGHNVTFTGKNKKTKEDLKRTPDYYLKVSNKYGKSWYFMDAKYKDFRDEENVPSKVYYVDEVYDVAVRKYINDIGSIFETNPDYDSNCFDIRGSYILMADINNKYPLDKSDRLFCKNNEIYNKELIRIESEAPTYSYLFKRKMPGQRYGAIILSPEYDDELTSLFQLIFEYLEALNDKDYPNFRWCWKCNSTHLDISQSSTIGGNRKYYTSCPKCGDYRVITNCPNSGGKHMIIKHSEGNYHYNLGPKWAFLCPECGAGL